MAFRNTLFASFVEVFLGLLFIVKMISTSSLIANLLTGLPILGGLFTAMIEYFDLFFLFGLFFFIGRYVKNVKMWLIVFAICGLAYFMLVSTVL
jgi:hypothetical protein